MRAMTHPFFALPRPIVFGHRGASGERPENTLISFERALEHGADVIETDVHLSRDGEVVVLHDADLARTTDGAGEVGSLDYGDIARLDAGHRFTVADGAAPFRGRGVRVPRLEEAFARFPGVRFNIELKHADTRLASAAVRERASGVALGASVADVLGFVRAALDGAAPPPGPLALQIPAEFLGRPLVTPELLAFAHAHGVQVHVWTVNDTAEMRRLLALGVDGIMSDFPGRLRSLVDALRGA